MFKSFIQFDQDVVLRLVVYHFFNFLKIILYMHIEKCISFIKLKIDAWNKTITANYAMYNIGIYLFVLFAFFYFRNTIYSFYNTF